MTEPREAIVACPECRGTGRSVTRLHDYDDSQPIGLTVGDVVHIVNAACDPCRGTGLVRIRAFDEDIPTIDRTPIDDK